MEKKLSRKSRLILLIGLLAFGLILGGASFAKRTKNIYLTLDDQQEKLHTTKGTLRKALEEAGYTHLDGAISDVDLDAPVRDGMLVQVNLQKTVHLFDGGVEKVYTTYTDTVGEFLEEQGVRYDEDDRLQPARQSRLESDQIVRLDRYSSEIIQDTMTLPFKTEELESNLISKGEEIVSQQGKEGKAAVEKKKIYKNGTYVSTQILSQETLEAPVNKIILKGTADSALLRANAQGQGKISLATFSHKGVINWNGYAYTYYSQRVLAGGGLQIPGRHVNADGFIADGDGFIVLAGSAAKGTVYPTPFGAYGKIYDRGTTGNHLDVYVR